MSTIMSQHGAGGGEKGRHCNATCHRAKKPKCACICGGRYHGVGSSEAAQQMLTKDWLGADWEQQVKARMDAPPPWKKVTREEVAFELFQERRAELPVGQP